ncbi:MAG: hypothetical protein ABR529_15795 [Actinomycetota bacterium]
MSDYRDSMFFHEGVQQVVQKAINDGKIQEGERYEWERRVQNDPERAQQQLAALHRPHPIADLVATAPKEPKPAVPSRPTMQTPHATASGIDWLLLLQVPEVARRAIAQEPDPGEAYAMLERYSGPEGEIEAGVDATPGGPLWDYRREHEEALERWAVDPNVPYADVAAWQRSQKS